MCFKRKKKETELDTLLEYLKTELSYSDDHYTSYDRMMLQKILKYLELLDILKHTAKSRHNEVQFYLSNKTDSDIGNGVSEHVAFNRILAWLREGEINNEESKF